MQLTPENRQRLHGTVFGKTAAGRAEVERRTAGLTARERAVLILLDGRKPLKDIGTWLPEDEMLASVEALLRKGLAGIEPRAAPPAPQRAAGGAATDVRAGAPGEASTTASVAPGAPASTRDPAAAPSAVLASDLRAAQALMVAAARKHLGLLAADLVRRIEQANDASQLAGVVGLWHVSLRESKTGKPCAEGLLEEARALLA